MTNNINGIDVSECTYSKIGIDKKCYCEQDLYDDGTPVFTCDECTNCYYKQFKRLQQENEELKKQLEFSRTHKTVLDAERINYKQAFEEIRYCNNCSNLGLDFKARKFYCSLSHRPDELPEVLSCDEFSTNCYIKRLQEENKELRQIRKNSPDIQEPYIYLYRQIKKQCYKLEEENKRLQMLSCANCGEKYLSPDGAELYDKMRDYKEALEEIREIVSDTCRKRCTNECLGTKKHCGYGKILNKINEVFNDN